MTRRRNIARDVGKQSSPSLQISPHLPLKKLSFTLPPDHNILIYCTEKDAMHWREPYSIGLVVVVWSEEFGWPSQQRVLHSILLLVGGMVWGQGRGGNQLGTGVTERTSSLRAGTNSLQRRSECRSIQWRVAISVVLQPPMIDIYRVRGVVYV